MSTIYREQAIDAMGCLNDSICEQQAIDALWELPSAEKISKWLDIGKFTDIGGNYHEVWKCDYCGYISYDDSNYCPQCGSKMVD